ncbi:hypothetical protein ACFVJK_30430 [Streptomyces sp. NPDC127172]|uniref:hypothetical protein n=1 Tax=Streptomyces sp. NPDC127172 TaxID=3345382 RepID=UPI00363DB164
MTFINLRKHAQPEPVEDVEDVDPDEAVEDDDGLVQEPEGHAVLGLLPALYQGVRGWCAWCSARIGVGPTWALHGFALYAAEHYSVWVTYGVCGPFMAAVLAFTPRESLERLAARLDARDAARAARRGRSTAPAADVPDESPAEPPVDPLPALMWRLIGDAAGVHLKTLTEALAEAAVGAGQRAPTKADVEAALEARNIPLRPSVRDTREKVNKGVHRVDLEAWESALSQPEPADPATGP